MPGMETRGAPRVGASFLAPHASLTALLGFRHGAVVCEAFDVPGHLTRLFDQDRPPASEGGPCKYKTRQKPTNQGSYREDTSMRAATVRLTLDWASASQECGRRSVFLRRAAGMHFRCWRENPGTRCEPVEGRSAVV